MTLHFYEQKRSIIATNIKKINTLAKQYYRVYNLLCGGNTELDIAVIYITHNI